MNAKLAFVLFVFFVRAIIMEEHSLGHHLHRVPAVGLPAAAADHPPHQVLGQLQRRPHPVRHAAQPTV